LKGILLPCFPWLQTERGFGCNSSKL